MIATQQIKSTISKPLPYKDYTVINVLKWKNSKWKTLSPYYLRTDGMEKNNNPGNVLFENFWQGSKVYDIVYENKVYPSKYHVGKPEHLWWSFIPQGGDEGDVLINDNVINYDLYFRWRDSLWSCQNPIRYPNKIHRRKNTKFSLVINGNEIRMDYQTARKEIYVKEYIRLVKKTSEYTLLLNKLKNNENIMICEVDVPAKGKRGNYGQCNDINVCELTLDIVEGLLNDTSEAFGHGLCLVYSLLMDMRTP